MMAHVHIKHVHYPCAKSPLKLFGFRWIVIECPSWKQQESSNFTQWLTKFLSRKQLGIQRLLQKVVQKLPDMMYKAWSITDLGKKSLQCFHILMRIMFFFFLSTVIHPLMIHHPHLIHFLLTIMSLNPTLISMKQIVMGSISSYLPLYKIWAQLRERWQCCEVFKKGLFLGNSWNTVTPLNDTPIILAFLHELLFKHSKIWYSHRRAFI